MEENSASTRPYFEEMELMDAVTGHLVKITLSFQDAERARIDPEFANRLFRQAKEYEEQEVKESRTGSSDVPTPTPIDDQTPAEQQNFPGTIKTRRSKKIYNRYTQETLQQALTAICERRISLGAASKEFGVPKTTLKDYSSRKSTLGKKAGRTQSIPAEIEKAFVAKVVDAANCGFPLSKRQFLVKVGLLVKKMKLRTQFKNNLPSEEYWRCVKKRHPELTIRIPEPFCSKGVRALNLTTVYNYFHKLEHFMKAHDFGSKPHVVWNVEEIGVQLFPTTAQGISKRGTKNAAAKTVTVGESVTTLVCGNADGRVMSPLFVIEGKSMKAVQAFATQDGPQGAVWAYQANALMENAIGLEWFQNVFLRSCGPERPQVLILDSHGSHEILEILDLARQEDIHLLALPPNSAHYLQPLDSVVIGPFEKEYKRVCTDFIMSNPNNKIDKNTWPGLIRRVWEKVITPELLRKAFLETGVLPVDRTRIPPEAFDLNFVDYSKVQKLPALNSEPQPGQSAFQVATTSAVEASASVSSLLQFQPSMGVGPASVGATEEVQSVASLIAPPIDVDDIVTVIITENEHENETNGEEEEEETANATTDTNGHSLTNDQIGRYSRQLILPELGVKGQEKLLTTKVLIVGAGGLGCPAAIYMAAAGIGTLGVVDYDDVEISNLHRQILHTEQRVGVSKAHSIATSCTSLNSGVVVIPHHVQLDRHNALDIIKEYDIVLDATDNVATRYLLNDACVLAAKPLVSGSALRLEGQVTVYNYQGGPCYRCILPKPPPPETVTNCSDGGVLGVVPGIIGSFQALEAVKIAANIGKSLSQRLLVFDGLDCSVRVHKLRGRQTSCPVCGDNPSITTLIDYEEFCGSRANDKDQEKELLPTEIRIKPKDYQSLIENGQQHVLVDVRLPVEMDICQLPHPALNIPLDAIKKDPSKQLERIKDSLASPEDPALVVVVCRRGNDSQRAVQLLQGMDTTCHFMDISGGLHAWARDVDPNFPVY